MCCALLAFLMCVSSSAMSVDAKSQAGSPPSLTKVVPRFALSPHVGGAPEIVTDCDTPDTYGRLCFPGGLVKSITFSFDDGRVYDYKLVEIMNRYGLRGTFHIVSGLLDKDSYVKSKDVKTLYANHEVAAHTVTHPNLTKCTDEELRHQVVDDCKALQALVGYPIRGLAYPGGETDDRIMQALPGFGIRYARVVGTHDWFAYPKRPLFWVTTCHISKMLEDGKKLMSFNLTPALMAIWGHSYEFNDNNSWDQIEEFGKNYGNRKDIWYATNIQTMDYYDAAKRLIVSMDGNTIKNPGKISVWATIRGKTYELKPGKVTKIAR